MEDALQEAVKLGENEFLIYSAGPARVNSMVMEFSNITERGLKSQGVKIKYFKIPPSWAKDNFNLIDRFAYFSNPKEQVSELAKDLDDKDVDVWAYRF
jgi:hypothetical protein